MKDTILNALSSMFSGEKKPRHTYHIMPRANMGRTGIANAKRKARKIRNQKRSK